MKNVIVVMMLVLWWCLPHSNALASPEDHMMVRDPSSNEVISIGDSVGQLLTILGEPLYIEHSDYAENTTYWYYFLRGGWDTRKVLWRIEIKQGIIFRIVKID